MSVQILRGNALALPLPDDSVDLVVTSPPYFGLRSYQDAGEHYGGQIGSEATPAEFVDALIAATREMVRVVKPSGSIWVNLGDKYATRYSSVRGGGRAGLNDDDDTRCRSGQNHTGAPEKSLIGIPWRYALACIDDLGLILRAEVIWSKPNGLPESVTDRVRRSHEQWFHFTLQPRYYSAVDEIREAHAGEFLSSGVRNPRHRYVDGKMPSHSAGILGPSSPDRKDGGVLVGNALNPLGKLPGSVWTIPTQPLTVPASLGIDHFAAFPMEWPRRIIRGWSPAGVCTGCGEGRRPVTTAEPFTAKSFAVDQQANGRSWHGGDPATRSLGIAANDRDRRITGYACGCQRACARCTQRHNPTETECHACGIPLPDTTAPTTPGVVLDPFGGTGTTALVAHANGRHGISVDMSADYCRLAEWRTTDPGQLASALEVDKPPVEINGQADLFEGIA